MTARDVLETNIDPAVPDGGRASIEAFAAEVLAADGQAYDGELAMLRGLVRTLRMVVRADDADLGEVRRLLHQHATDDAEAKEESGRLSASSASDKPSARDIRLAQLLDTIRARPGKWSTRTLQDYRRATGGPTQRGTARRDLAELHRRGHLLQHGAGDGRFYTLANSRKDGRR